MDQDLRRRLARFDRPGAVAPAAAPRSGGDPLRSLLDAGASWCGTAPTGYLRLERALGPAPDPALARTLAPDLSAAEFCVLDTETTGLESGTGTLVFMVGLVHWTARSQRLVQLFLPEPAGERALLRALAEELPDAAAFVSYNGRGFDVPRLRSRLRLQRMDDSVLDRPHLDLLYPARRLARHWLADARLKTVEEAFLGEARRDDLPGEFAPEVYRVLQFENRDIGLAEVLRHNARDVENLPRLLESIARVLSGEELHRVPASCALEAARSHLERGDGPRAARLLERAVESDDAPVRARARALRAKLYRRAGEPARAAAEWETRIRERPSDLPARVELAKLLEHRLGDLPRALELVREARTLLVLRGEVEPTLSEALDHRYRRLVRRLGRTS